MNLRKSITAAVAALAVMAPAGTAFASTSDVSAGSEAGVTSTTVPARTKSTNSAEFRASILAWQTATRTWLNARVAAMTEYREALASASSSMKSALEAATTKDARKAAMQSFKNAREAAKAELDAALAELGDRPVKPTK
jgi:hypothetical protein